jgi:hypothetical protein
MSDRTIIFFVNLWLPIADIRRRWQWRAEGKDPNTPEYYTSQISPDGYMSKVIMISGNVGMLAQYFHQGDQRKSRAVNLLGTYCAFRWLPYDDWEAINTLFTLDKPGEALIDWFLTVEEIPKARLPWLTGQDAKLEHMVEIILAMDLSKK